MRNKAILFLVSCFLIGVFTPSHKSQAQQPTEFEKQLVRNTLDKAFSGKDGALEVSLMFAGCNGFQSSLYNHLTRQAIMRNDDILLAQKISRQSLTAGWAATVLVFDHKEAPDQHVNLIANDVRRKWRPKLSAMGNDLDKTVWEQLAKCTHVAPASEILLEMAEKDKEEK